MPEGRADRGEADLRIGPQFGEVTEEDPPRDAVDDEVVQDHQQPARPVRTGGERHDPDHHPHLRVQFGPGLAGLGDDHVGERRVGHAGHVDAAHAAPRVDRTGRADPQPRATQPRPQHVVVVEQSLHDGDEAGLGQVAVRAQQHRLADVTERVQVVQPAHDRRQRQVPDRLRSPGHGGVHSGQDGRDARDRLVPEHVARAEHEAGRPGPAHQLDGQDAVPTEREEVVVGTHLGQAKHLGHEVAEHGLGSGPRCAAARAFRCGQRVPVELPVGGQRDLLDHQHGRRHQVRGQDPRQVVRQRAGIGLPGRDHVGHQPVRADHGDRLPHRVVPGQRRAHLAGLDAEPAQLHLVVGPAEEHERAAGGPPDQVTGAVHPAGRERVRDEPLRRRVRPAEVTAGQAGSGDVQLTGDTRWHRVQLAVEHVHPGVRDRTADGRHTVAGQRAARGRAHRGLGGSVGVDEPAARRPVRHHCRRARLARHHECRERGQRPARVRRGERDRRQGRVRDASPRDQVEQLVPRRDRFGGHDERGARQQRHAHLPHRRVEAGRRELQHPGVRSDGEAFALRVHEAGEAAVGDDDPLRRAGRARREDEVGRVGGGRAGQVTVRLRGVVRVHDRDVVRGQPRCPVGHHHGGLGRVEDERQPPGGQVDVDRDVHPARLGHGEERDDPVRRARQGDRDGTLRPHAALSQHRREPGGALVEFGVGEPVAAAFDRDRGGPRGDLPGEQRRQGVRWHIGLGVVVAHGDPCAFGVVEHAHRAQRCGRRVGDRAQQPHVPVGDRHHGRVVEQVGAVLEEALHAVVVLREAQREVELRHGTEPRLVGDGHTRQAHRGLRVVVERDHHLEQRVVRGRPLRVEHLDQVLEREVGVGVRGEVGVADAVDQLGERRVPRQVGAQHDRVDEEPDQVVERAVGAAGDG